MNPQWCSVLLFAIFITLTTSSDLIISTEYGDVEGEKFEFGSHFRFPYAAPPIGNLRWRPPQSHLGWISIGRPLPMVEPRICPQQQRLGDEGEMSEDCLQMNIFTPFNHLNPFPTSPSSLLPVMLWLHGGGFILGSSNNPMYNGSYLTTAGPVILVSINYRFGHFGFMALEELTEEARKLGEDTSSGNYGFLDQVFALKFLKQNIRNFGGDPNRMTIFGESAGAISAQYHLLSPKSAGLFQGAIMQSVPTLMPLLTLHQAYIIRGQPLLRHLNCLEKDINSSNQTLLECIRSRSWEQILSMFRDQSILDGNDPNLPHLFEIYGGVCDGIIFPEQPVSAFENGHFNKVPSILGFNKDEGTLFAIRYLMSLKADLVQDALQRRYGIEMWDDIIQAYPDWEANPWVMVSRLLGDILFHCPGRITLHHIAQYTPTFSYQWHAIPSSSRGSSPFGSMHSSELIYLFRGGTLFFKPTLDELDFETRSYISEFWFSLAYQVGILNTSNIHVLESRRTTDVERDKTHIIWPKFHVQQKAPTLVFALNTTGPTRIVHSPQEEHLLGWNRCTNLWDLHYYERLSNSSSSSSPIFYANHPMLDETKMLLIDYLLNIYGLPVWFIWRFLKVRMGLRNLLGIGSLLIGIGIVLFWKYGFSCCRRCCSCFRSKKDTFKKDNFQSQTRKRNKRKKGRKNKKA